MNADLLPGMSGDTGSIVRTSVQTLEDAALCVGTLSVLNCFSLVIDLAMLGWELYQNFFPARPKVGVHSASDSTALFFIPSANPVIALWGIGIRELEAVGVPTSTSAGPGLVALERIATAVLHDLEKQFDNPKAPKLYIKGVLATGHQVFQWYQLLGFTQHNPASSPQTIQERIIVDRLYQTLVGDGWIDPKTGFPFPPVVIPPPPPPPPAAGGFDPRVALFLQQIENCICAELAPEMRQVGATLIQVLQVLAVTVDLSKPSAWKGIFDQLSGLRVGIDAGLAKLANVLVPEEVAALNRIATAAERMFAEETKIDPALLLAIQQIEKCICVDLPAKLDASLEKVTKEKAKDDAALWDVPQGVLDELFRLGAAPHELSQVVRGAPPGTAFVPFSIPWLDAFVARHTAWLRGGTTPALSPPTDFAGLLRTVLVGIFDHWLKASEGTFGVAGAEILGVIDKHLNGLGHVEPGGQLAAAKVALGDAFGVGTAAHLALALAELADPIKNLGLAQLATFMEELGGFREVASAIHGPQLAHAVRIPADYESAEKHRSSKPGAGQALQMFARRLISDAQSTQYLAWHGFSDTIINQLQADAYRPIQPRVWIQAADDTPINEAGIRESMRYGGQREHDIDTFIQAAHLQSIKSLRHKYLDAAVAAAEKGTIPVSKLTEVFHNLTIDDEARNLILDHLEITRIGRLALEYKSAWDIKARARVISPAEYRVALQHIPLADTEINVQVAILEAHLAADTEKEQERELLQIQHQTRAEEVRAALARYHTGETNAVGLTASLIAAGLTPALAAAYLALATTRAQENRAATLKAEIRSMVAQYKKDLITRHLLTVGLQAAGMSARDAELEAEYLDAIKAKKAK